MNSKKIALIFMILFLLPLIPITTTTHVYSVTQIQEERRVNNDYTIRYKNKYFQLDKVQPTTVYKKDIVIVEEHLDRQIKIRIRDKYLNYQILPERPKKVPL